MKWQTPCSTNNVRKAILSSLLFFVFVSAPCAMAAHGGIIREASGPARLWNDPSDIRTRDLYYGPGGKQHEPHGPFTFEKEDPDGTSPKFNVVDRAGVKWKVKLAWEAQPETVATRLLWAAGYYADEDYYLPKIKVEGLPQLHRGQEYVLPDGWVLNARLKRSIKGEQKVGDWSWKNNPFTGTRELNGLRVMMALIDNWDLKNVNNSVYEYDGERIYMVSDLGSSFATNGRGLTRKGSKGDLEHFEESRFITQDSNGRVSFATPAHMSWIYFYALPDFISRLQMEAIGRDIPAADARWIGQILAQLSRSQIKSAFQAAGYSPEQVDAFATVVETRIRQLTDL